MQLAYTDTYSHLHHILMFLTLQDLLTLVQVSKDYQGFCLKSSGDLFRRDFSPLVSEQIVPELELRDLRIVGGMNCMRTALFKVFSPNKTLEDCRIMFRFFCLLSKMQKSSELCCPFCSKPLCHSNSLLKPIVGARVVLETTTESKDDLSQSVLVTKFSCNPQLQLRSHYRACLTGQVSNRPRVRVQSLQDCEPQCLFQIYITL